LTLCFGRMITNFYNWFHPTTPPLSFRVAVIKFYFIFLKSSIRKADDGFRCYRPIGDIRLISLDGN
ncbi:MAG: hypothetical protein VW907_01275, partial [Opitutae bacterium]